MQKRKPELKSHRRCSDGTRMLVTSTESDQETQRKSQSRTDWGQKRLAPEISADYRPPSLPWKNWKSISEEQLWSLLRSILKSLTLAPTYKHKCIRVHLSAHPHRCPAPPPWRAHTELECVFSFKKPHRALDLETAFRTNKLPAKFPSDCSYRGALRCQQ